MTGQIESTMNTPEGKQGKIGDNAFGAIVRYEMTKDSEAWSIFYVVAVHGKLPETPEGWDIETIERDLAQMGVEIVPDSYNGAGNRFSEAPWIRILGNGRTIVMEQSGGRDV